MAQITITRALAECKALNDRIQRITRDTAFITHSTGGRHATGQAIQEIEQKVASGLQQVKDLIARRQTLKSAIVRSNAVTNVTINGVTMTVAEAIERKGSIILEIQLMNTLAAQQQQVVLQVERGNVQVKQRLDQMLVGLTGKDRKVTQDEIDAITIPFNKANELTLIDPLNLLKVIAEMDADISGFQSEVDFVLSESNASTKIDA